MQGVESDQRWGAGSAGYDTSVPVGFKGGWGPEDGGGYLVRQSAIVTARNGQGWVLTYLAKPSDGSFGTGTQMLTALAAWAARDVPAGRRTAIWRRLLNPLLARGARDRGTRRHARRAELPPLPPGDDPGGTFRRIAAKFYRGVRPLRTTCYEGLKGVQARCYDYT